MTPLVCLLAFSVLIQFLTCALAFRINCNHGWRWPWVWISGGIAVMTVRRAITLYFAWLGNAATSEELSYEGGSLRLGSAVSSLIASVLLFMGVSSIGRLFTKLTIAEKLLLEQNRQLESDVTQAQTQFEAAREIQQTLYPLTAPRVPGYEIAGSTIPALAAGGDYFDFLPMRKGAWGIAVGDVSGHGLGPALMMAQLHAYLRALVGTLNDPREILQEVNALLIAPKPTGHFVTLFFAQFDPSCHQFRYFSAAHPGYVYRGDKDLQLPTGSPPLGMFPDLEIPPAIVFDLKPNDLLIIPTDGITEAFSPNKELYGLKRLMETIGSCREESPDRIIQELQGSLRAFTEADHFQDDVTLVVLKRSGEAPKTAA